MIVNVVLSNCSVLYFDGISRHLERMFPFRLYYINYETKFTEIWNSIFYKYFVSILLQEFGMLL